MSYTWAALLAVVLTVAVDLGVARTRLVRHRLFWASYAIVLFFQLVVNGLLTGLRIVRYDPARILGPRIAFAPVEDLLFGFAMVLLTLTVWVWLGRVRPSLAAPAEPPATRSTRPARDDPAPRRRAR